MKFLNFINPGNLVIEWLSYWLLNLAIKLFARSATKVCARSATKVFRTKPGPRCAFTRFACKLELNTALAEKLSTVENAPIPYWLGSVRWRCASMVFNSSLQANVLTAGLPNHQR